MILTNRVFVPFSLLVLVGSALAADAQSLADVAQREAERRKAVATGKVYTNESLGPGAEGSAPAPPTPAATGTPDAAAGKPETPAADKPAAADDAGGVVIEVESARTEAYWRKLMRDLRARLTQSTTTLAAQQARLAEIDGAPATPATAREREVIAAAIPKLQEGIRYQTEDIARWIARAKAEKVPPDWIQ